MIFSFGCIFVQICVYSVFLVLSFEFVLSVGLMTLKARMFTGCSSSGL